MQLAQGLTVPGFSTPITAPSGVPTGGLAQLQPIMKNGLVLVLVLTVVLALFFLILGGIKWSASGGDKQALDTARKQITFSLVGLVIAFMALLIIAVMGRLFGVTLFS